MRVCGPREYLFLLGNDVPGHFFLGLGMDGPPRQLVILCCSHQYNPSIHRISDQGPQRPGWGPGYHL